MALGGFFYLSFSGLGLLIYHPNAHKNRHHSQVMVDQKIFAKDQSPAQGNNGNHIRSGGGKKRRRHRNKPVKNHHSQTGAYHP
ncbi:MAG TPA: hypothetical protein DCE13_06960 [Cryomorphaceae bacterium]|nr:hypothetical protein [Cryomorphaceae bacterium]